MNPESIIFLSEINQTVDKCSITNYDKGKERNKMMKYIEQNRNILTDTEDKLVSLVGRDKG